MLQPEAGPVYTDGSAHGAGTDFAAAAVAIIQLLDQVVGAGYIACTGVIPSCMPASAAAAERVAIAVGSTLLGEGQAAAFRSDCLSAVREAQSIHAAASFARPWGGLWRQVEPAAIAGIEHVRARQAAALVGSRDTLHVATYANSVVDALAGRRAAQARPGEVARALESADRAAVPKAWAGALAHGARGHTLWVSAVLGFEHCGPVRWCARCGAYACSRRAGGLAATCPASASSVGAAVRLARLKARRHPITRLALTPATRVRAAPIADEEASTLSEASEEQGANDDGLDGGRLAGLALGAAG